MLVEHDSLDLGDGLHSRYERLRDTSRHAVVLVRDALGGRIHNGCYDVYAMCECDDDNCDSLSIRDGDSRLDSSPNTKLSDKLRMLATRTNQIW